jgi:hypothetical protein
MCFDVENECIRKKFHECNTRDFFIGNTKGIFFWEFSWMLIFFNTSNPNLADVFYE